MPEPVVVIVWFGCGFLCTWLAARKNRRMGCWFCLGVLLGPIGVVWVALLPWKMPAEVEVAYQRSLDRS